MTEDPKILFAPEDRIISYMMDQFLSARRTIEIVVFLIGSKRVANALVKARKRGIAIRMIIDAKVARSRYSKDDFLKGKGIEVKTIRVRGGSMHSKFILIDGEKLIAGSANLTNDANYRNHEFIFVSEDPEIIEPFTVKFKEMWAVSKKQTSRSVKKKLRREGAWGVSGI
ncbi:MAG: DUF1669 domain-containing protein [Deltaproteobacteria bacterium]|nr:DUF1669 domain-containing protein [Deltaproteobacteria bacterium]MBW1976010.1 DUF1669 domain-containing protein [Deltaproteobacteria bacterium]MBW2127644.1 DUF1669 domain-containing protein [Deltaproteobacteria bacterium]